MQLFINFFTKSFFLSLVWNLFNVLLLILIAFFLLILGSEYNLLAKLVFSLLFASILLKDNFKNRSDILLFWDNLVSFSDDIKKNKESQIPEVKSDSNKSKINLLFKLVFETKVDKLITPIILFYCYAEVLRCIWTTNIFEETLMPLVKFIIELLND